MRRESPVRFREGLGVQFPRATRLVILCRSQAEAEQALTVVRQWCTAAGLVVHPTKTRIVDVRQEGFDFLGFHFQTTRRGILTRWPRRRSLDKLKANLRAKTRRNNGHDLATIMASVNQTLRGWFGYFKHSYYTTFVALDSWIRGRLRSILRKRAGGRGRGRGADHHRWPNAYFANLGYFSLETARHSACQPSGG
jgi:RNA-directed DNA polymerase